MFHLVSRAPAVGSSFTGNAPVLLTYKDYPGRFDRSTDVRRRARISRETFVQSVITSPAAAVDGCSCWIRELRYMRFGRTLVKRLDDIRSAPSSCWAMKLAGLFPDIPSVATRFLFLNGIRFEEIAR